MKKLFFIVFLLVSFNTEAAQTKYSYVDTIDTNRLTKEVNDNTTITTILDGILVIDSTNFDIYFSDALSAGEKTELDSIVSSHAPTPLMEGRGKLNFQWGASNNITGDARARANGVYTSNSGWPIMYDCSFERFSIRFNILVENTPGDIIFEFRVNGVAVKTETFTTSGAGWTTLNTVVSEIGDIEISKLDRVSFFINFDGFAGTFDDYLIKVKCKKHKNQS